MSNRTKVMQKRFVPPLACFSVAAPLLFASANIAPNVVGDGFYPAFWLGAVSVATLIGAAILTVIGMICAAIAIDDWLDE